MNLHTTQYLGYWKKKLNHVSFIIKKEALKWNELLPEEQRYEVKKHTEIIEVMA